MNAKQILLINDMPGYGKVATAAMLPILSYMGHPTYNLPTALVSNTLDYGKFHILDTTDYMQGVFPVWRELGFRFDAVATGFIVSQRQAEIVADYCTEQSREGAAIYVDPIMGDEGKLYNGVTEESVESMRHMVSVADVCYPNYTEACYLTGAAYQAEGVSLKESRRLLDGLRALGAKSPLITSVKVEGQPAVIGWNDKTGESFLLPYDEIPGRFPGTGDAFSAILVGHLLDGVPLKQATRKAMDSIRLLIEMSQDSPDRFHGILLENYLRAID